MTFTFKDGKGHELGKVLFIVPNTNYSRKTIVDCYWCETCKMFFRCRIKQPIPVKPEIEVEPF